MIDEKIYCYKHIPDIIIPGFSRSGTTTMYNILIQHNKIMKCEKEMAILNNPYKFFKLKKSYSNKLLINGTDIYISDPIFYKLLKYLNINNKKFIIMIRNPIDAFISYYLTAIIRKNKFPEKLNFSDKKFQKTLNLFKFSIHLNKCLQYCKNIMIINLETLNFEVINNIWKFLNLSSIQLKEIPHVNDFKEIHKKLWNREIITIPKYTYEEWKKIRDFYEEDIYYIYKIINVDYKKWLNIPNKKYFKNE